MNYNVISDDFIRNNNRRILSGYEIQPRNVSENKAQSGNQNTTKRENDSGKVNDNHKRILMAVENGQYKLTKTEVCQQAGFPGGSGSRLLKECVKMNFVRVILVPFGKGRPQYPVLLPEGYKVLGIKEKKFSGRGAGYEHTLYQHLIKDHFSCFNPVIECFRNGKHFDIGIETNEFLLAIEIAMTSVHEKENIEKDFSLAKTDVVLVACINEKVQKEVQDILIKIPEKIKKFTDVFLIAELLKKNPNELIHNHQLKMNL